MRHNDKKRGVIVVIMQRLNELDLSGYLLELGLTSALFALENFGNRRQSSRVGLPARSITPVIDYSTTT
jgi:hypothetical protein